MLKTIRWLLPILLLISGTAFGQTYVQDQGGSNNSGSTGAYEYTPMTWGTAVTSGNFLVGMVRDGNNQCESAGFDSLSVSDNGSPSSVYSAAITYNDTVNGTCLVLPYAMNVTGAPTVSTMTTTTTAPSNGDAYQVIVMGEFSGIYPSGALDTGSACGSTTASATSETACTITTTAPVDLLIECPGWVDGQATGVTVSAGVGSDTWHLFSTSEPRGGPCAYALGATPGTHAVTFSWTSGALPSESVGAAFQVVTSGQDIINWTGVDQQIQGFGSSNLFVGTKMNAYDNLLFGTLGYSLLRSSVPIGNGQCDGSPSSGCATGQDSVTDMQACVANGCSVWATGGDPPPEYNSSGTYQCTVSPALIVEYYGAYASYVTNFVASLRTYEGVPLYAISVANEPDLPPPGCQMSASALDSFIKNNLAPTMTSAGQTATKIMMPESSQYSSLTSVAGTCVGDSACLRDIGIIAYHGYDNPSTPTDPYANPPAFWETEVSNGPGNVGPTPPGCTAGVWCPGISDALFWAGVVDNAMVDGNNSWSYFWYVDVDNTSIDPGGVTNANWALINPAQTIPVSIRTYAIANFAKFVRPGYYRIAATHTPQSGVLVTSYQNVASTSTSVTVAINTNGSTESQQFCITPGTAPTFLSMTPYVTSAGLSLAAQSAIAVSGNCWTATLAASSVTTFVGTSSTMAAVANPTCTPPGGTFPSATTVTCSTTTAGASMYYTTSGTPPSCAPSGNGYSGPVTISSNATLEIIGCESGYTPSGVVSYPFTINSAVATYYVDYTNGSDSNNGTSKTTPWKYAPGMAGSTGVSASTTLNAGDSVILKGCVTWPNSAFTWTIPYGGNSSAPIYYGVDQTWWDSTVSGCASAWNRPIMDLQGMNPTDSLARIVIYYEHPYVVLDNFEWIDIAANLSPYSMTPGNALIGASLFAGSPGNSSVQNMYVHHWINPCFTIGTGNLTNGLSTVTNYVPFSYSPSASAISTTWGVSGQCVAAKLQAPNGGIPIGNNTPLVTGVTGTNPYAITFTNSAGGATENCAACLIEVGNDWFTMFAGVEGPTTNDIAQNNVMDGSDTAEVQMNPYGDCGLTESNNNMCVASGTFLWRVPNIFRNNVVQFVENGAVGECSEWSGNLIQYIRLSADPTAHTNFVECLNDNPINGATLFYNNVIRHGTNPNPNTPTGRYAVGVGAIWYTPVVGETAYFFNNVFYDVLANIVFERASSAGTTVAFNNTADCGVSWSLTNICANAVSGDLYENNYLVTTASPALTGSGFTQTTNLTQTPAAATADGYTETETYAYSPTSGSSPTVGAGTNGTAAICPAISSAQAAAGVACLAATNYAVTYNTVNHTAVCCSLPANPRPTSGAWDIGAYQNAVSPGAPGVGITWAGCSGPCSASYNFGNQLVGTNSGTLTVTVTDTGSANLTISNVALTTGTQFTVVSNTCLLSLAPTQHCTFGLVFNPTSTGAQTDTLTITDNASPTTQTIALTGTGTSPPPPAVSITWAGCTSACTAYSFGNEVSGDTTAALTVTVTNTGGSSLVMTSEVLTAGTQFTVVAPNTCATNTITVGGSCAFGVTFNPTSTGAKSDTLTITDNAGTQTVAFSGTGVAAPTPEISITLPGCSAACSAYNFGNQYVTQSGSVVIVVSSVGTANLVMTSEAMTTGTVFVVAANSCGTNTIAPPGACTVTLNFNPVAIGSQSDTLTIVDNVGTQTISVSGTGVSVPPTPSSQPAGDSLILVQ